MQCYVPFCKNTSEQKSPGISFHSFPSDEHLCATWLKALGKEDTHLPDSAVVCSRHFLNDDIYVTDSGLRQIHTSAIPSIILVCVICLDTDSKLFLMRKHKLGEAYEMLTGHPLCDPGNFKQTVCVQCAQKLINFSKFRNASLRAHTLMMQLIEKHEPITEKDIKLINDTKNQLRSNLVVSMFNVNPCDLHIHEEPSNDKQTESKEFEFRVEVKSEESNDSMWGDDEVINDEYYDKDSINHCFVNDPLKNKSAPFQCTICSEEFVHENAYKRHICRHIQVGDDNTGKSEKSTKCEQKTFYSATPLSRKRATKSEREVQAEQVEILQDSVQVFKTEASRSDSQFHTSCITDNDGTTNSEIAPKLFKQLSQNADIGHTTTKRKVNKSNKSKYQSIFNKKNCFSCDICRKTFRLKGILVNHMKTHSDKKPFNCKLCHFKSKHKDSLASHLRTHTGEKPYLCELCDYRCDRNDRLLQHMRRHTGEKPFSCKSCHYKCTTSGQLVRHTRTHTGERPYSCTLCEYKCTQSSDLVKHMRIHSGDKPYACKLCQFKCVQKSHLVQHMRTQHAKS